MDITLWIFLCLLCLAFSWGLDRYFALKDIEKDLKIYLSDVFAARDVAEPRFKAIYASQAAQIKQLIRNHFTL